MTRHSTLPNSTNRLTRRSIRHSFIFSIVGEIPTPTLLERKTHPSGVLRKRGYPMIPSNCCVPDPVEPVIPLVCLLRYPGETPDTLIPFLALVMLHL